jgi:hypothetical protein
MHPIIANFANDPTRNTSGFEGTKGLQFAYQCLYRTGEESAISTYSDIVVPPAYIEQGTSPSPNLIANNLCKLTIPKVVNEVDVWTTEIEKIRILARSGNDGNFFVIDEVEAENEDIVYSFYNDRVLTFVPKEDEQKYFDSLPRKARAQSVINNRLIYGNYVEGFDEPDVDADITPIYRDRPIDFITLQLEAVPIVLAQDVSYTPEGQIDSDSYDVTPNRRAGYRIDTSNVPDSISEGTVLNVNLSVSPKKNWHIYDTENSPEGDAVSHHLSKDVFGLNNDPALNQIENHGTSLKMFGTTSLNGGDSTLSVSNPGSSNLTPVSIGTSASNPFIIPGGALSFSLSIRFNQEVDQGARGVVKDVLEDAFSGGDLGPQFDLLNDNTSSSYSFDLGFGDQGQIILEGSDDYRKNLIFAVRNANDGVDAKPAGFFVLNSGTVEFKFEVDTQADLIDEFNKDVFLSLKIEDLNITSTRTCVPKIKEELPSENLDIDGSFFIQKIEKWDIYSSNYLTSNSVGTASENNLLFVEDDNISLINTDFSLSNLIQRQSLANLSLFNIQNVDLEKYSLVDGESYFYNNAATHSVGTFASGSVVGIVTYSSPYGSSQGSVSFNNVFFGTTSPFSLILQVGDIGSGDQIATGTNIDASGPIVNGPVPGLMAPSFSVPDPDNVGYIQPLEGLPSEVDILNFGSFFTEPTNALDSRSFKTKANHDFGIVYYDERGRSGVVNHLGTAYVKGYANSERQRKGKVDMLIDLKHQPPSWAHHYQIVYSGNSSVSKFIQYSAGGGFIANQESADGNIYVSLNYLQNNKTASYVSGFGASNTEGGDDMYVFKKGDKLRVVSYYNTEEARVFPLSYDFDIVDSVVLSDSPDENPLYIEGENEENQNTAPKAKTGQFLVLKNNPNAFGFTYNDISSGSTVDSNSNKWNSRCVVEIYSPLKYQDVDSKAYYEISKVYNVVTEENSQELKHQTDSILITNGDVWWRRVPVNMPEYIEEENRFKNIIQEDNSQPRFRDYYLESMTFNDTVIGSDVNSFGKIKLIDFKAKEKRRDSSLTYSDFNNYSTSLIRFTSFNAARLPYKDLPNEHGPITSTVNFSDSLFCIQEDKCSAIPVERNILSDAVGNDTIVSTAEILGTQRFYAGDYGCEDHPESVIKIENNIYFVSLAKREVYRFNPSNGITPISESGMKSYFYNVLSDPDINRVTSGYDPINDEYLLSWRKALTLPVEEVTQLFYDQPETDLFINEGPSQEPPSGFGDEGDGGSGGGVTDGGDDTDGGGGDVDGGGDTENTYTQEELNEAVADAIEEAEQGFEIELEEKLSEQQQAVLSTLNEIISAFPGISAVPETLEEAYSTVEGNIDSNLDLINDLENQVDVIGQENILIGLASYVDLPAIFLDILLQLEDENENKILTLDDLPPNLKTLLELYEPIEENADASTIFIEQYIDLMTVSPGLFFQLPNTPNYKEQIKNSVQNVITNLAQSVSVDTAGADAIRTAFDPNSTLTYGDVLELLNNYLERDVFVDDEENPAGGQINVKYIGPYQVQVDDEGQRYFEDEDGIRYNIFGPTQEQLRFDTNYDGTVGASDLQDFLTVFGLQNLPTQNLDQQLRIQVELPNPE